VDQHGEDHEQFRSPAAFVAARRMPCRKRHLIGSWVISHGIPCHAASCLRWRQRFGVRVTTQIARDVFGIFHFRN
jgi:hypothetical protein